MTTSNPASWSARFSGAFGALLFMAVALLITSAAWAQAGGSYQTDHARVSLLSAETELIPGSVQRFALQIEPNEGWHTYWRNPGEVGRPTAIRWELPPGVKAGDIEWPVPQRKIEPGGVSYIYSGEHLLPFSLAIGEHAALSNSSVRITAHANWLICKDLCIPESATLSLELPFASPTTELLSLRSPHFDAIQNALKSVPELNRSTQVSFQAVSIDASDSSEHLVFTIDASQLPPIANPPAAYVAEQAIVKEAHPAKIDLQESTLLVTFEKDPYVDELPEHLALVLTGFSEADVSSGSIEFHAEHNAGATGTGASAPSALAAGSNAGGTATAELSILQALLFAFIGGLILNAMPCVLPVLSLKVIGLLEHNTEKASVRQKHGIYYTLGVVLSFVAIAALLVFLRAVGEQVGWGFQMQSPGFVATMALLLFIMGLSLSGFVEIGTGLQNIGNSLTDGENRLAGTFWTGVLATIVATPCTAPLMGPAIGYALSQPPWISLAIFMSMGLGLASPFLLIAYVPQAQKFLPQPGQWMVTFKEVMAFPLYLTAVWLLWIFARQTSADATAILLLALVFSVIALWAWKKQASARLLDQRAVGWQVTATAATAGCLLGVYLSSGAEKAADGNINWGDGTTSALIQSENLAPGSKLDKATIDYSETALAKAIADGQTVLVNMTADWCITCKVNERIALKSDSVVARLSDDRVTYIKGDWTNSDPAITAFLESHQRNGVPLYVVYKPGEEPALLPQILTPGIVLDALN